ncbi:uncharacterized protein VTP21DRAFT_10638 [Calcarisporiella thermophila]|uniref:uncharacterized protein n=1 Tax=Calcarisporiella thermophila TaxID=911321 RepID=UPI003742E3C0
MPNRAILDEVLECVMAEIVECPSLLVPYYFPYHTMAFSLHLEEELCCTSGCIANARVYPITRAAYPKYSQPNPAGRLPSRWLAPARPFPGSIGGIGSNPCIMVRVALLLRGSFSGYLGSHRGASPGFMAAGKLWGHVCWSLRAIGFVFFLITFNFCAKCDAKYCSLGTNQASALSFMHLRLSLASCFLPFSLPSAVVTPEF